MAGDGRKRTMRTTDFAPSDAYLGAPCGAPHPFHDLSPDLTCLRSSGHQWEHATRLTGRRSTDTDDGTERPRFDWVWWGDPNPLDRDQEEARLEAVAYVGSQVAKQVAKHEAYLAVGHRLRRFVAILVVAVFLSIYLSAGAFSRFVAECYQIQHVGHWRAVICNRVFPGDPHIVEGPGRTYQPPR